MSTWTYFACFEHLASVFLSRRRHRHITSATNRGGCGPRGCRPLPSHLSRARCSNEAKSVHVDTFCPRGHVLPWFEHLVVTPNNTAEAVLRCRPGLTVLGGVWCGVVWCGVVWCGVVVQFMWGGRLTLATAFSFFFLVLCVCVFSVFAHLRV